MARLTAEPESKGLRCKTAEEFLNEVTPDGLA
jgi:hypothetical protein